MEESRRHAQPALEQAFKAYDDAVAESMTWGSWSDARKKQIQTLRDQYNEAQRRFFELA